MDQKFIVRVDRALESASLRSLSLLPKRLEVE
jgi:hypothetical protein